MTADAQLERAAQAAAEEVLRLVYGDDLQGCAVRIDTIAEVINAALQEQTQNVHGLAELQSKGFEAVALLATPPSDGHTLAPEDLRSLLSERLDNIRTLASRILSVTDQQGSEPRAEQI